MSTTIARAFAKKGLKPAGRRFAAVGDEIEAVMRRAELPPVDKGMILTLVLARVIIGDPDLRGQSDRRAAADQMVDLFNDLVDGRVGANRARMLRLIIRLHGDGVLSEGQVVTATGLDRVEVRRLAAEAALAAERERGDGR